MLGELLYKLHIDRILWWLLLKVLNVSVFFLYETLFAFVLVFPYNL